MIYNVAIIGTGFAGLTAALRLLKEGEMSFIMLERAEDIGGTWRDNTYPGCACDVAAPLYSFAKEQNPGWSRLYAGQAEILSYMKSVVNKYQLREKMRFGTDITGATWDRDQKHWILSDSKANIYQARIVLAGLGPLNRPNKPNLPGLENFKGVVMHSAEWNHEVSFKEQRVAVIGTGASAIQIIPSLTPIVKEMHVIQRSAAWVTDRMDSKASNFSKLIYTSIPVLLTARRTLIYRINEFFGLGFTGNKTIHALMRWAALRKVRKEVKNPEIRKKLIPDYEIGCKRILKSDDYYPVYNEPHVHLHTDSIKEISEDTVSFTDGTSIKVDILVLATGFHVSDLNFPIRVTGLDGLDLMAELKMSGGDTYKGMTISGFPNLSLLLGPNTGLGHNSVVHMMESQMNYLWGYVKFILEQDNRIGLDVKRDVVEKYIESIQERFKGTVWASGCKSWYINEQGKNNTLYPGLNDEYRRVTREFRAGEYDMV